MKKRFFLLIIALSAALSLSACQLAKPETVQPEMIGMAVEMVEANASWVSDEDEIVYAKQEKQTLTSEDGEVTADFTEFKFEGEDVFPFFLARLSNVGGSFLYNHSGDRISVINVSVTGEGTEYRGTLFVSPEYSGAFRICRVYQTSEDEIYFIRSGDDEKIVMDDPELAYTGRVSGTVHDGDVEIVFSSVIIFQRKIPVESAAILQMNNRNELISRDEYPAHELPESLTIAKDTDYLIIESRKAGESKAEREVFVYKQEQQGYTFYRDENGICAPAYITFMK